jgi:hypothetical protein
VLPRAKRSALPLVAALAVAALLAGAGISALLGTGGDE